ncbi:hypothetical protein [Streptomyces violascens]|uniref:hypothetical protein n=1 Tax=Streptomyces violascens TaxID=67381 RepID=UPI0016765C12|nr:hypothetical protein [Streptomyces violascens]
MGARAPPRSRGKITTAFRCRSALFAAAGAGVLCFALAGCGSSDASDAPVEHKSFAFGGKVLTIDAGHSTVLGSASTTAEPFIHGS